MSNYCDLCSMYFQDEYALQGHLAGKKHFKKFKQAQLLNSSIIVTKLPKFIRAYKLLYFFKKYGAIKWYNFGPDYLIIQFYDR